MIDQTAKAAYVVDGTNWIGTDVPETFTMKIDAARQRGLGGLMVRLLLDRDLVDLGCFTARRHLKCVAVRGSWTKQAQSCTRTVETKGRLCFGCQSLPHSCGPSTWTTAKTRC